MFLMKKECKAKRYRRFVRNKTSNLAKDHDMSVSKDKFPTIYAEKPDSIPAEPLPVFWPTN